MSEEDRTHVYAWLREEIGERRAEYVMSCLAPVPLADLVTKEHLTDELSRFAALLRLEVAEQRVEDRKETAAEFAAVRAEMAAGFKAMAAQRAEDRKETAAEFAAVRAEMAAGFKAMAAQREEDRKEASAQREADRSEAKQQFRWVIGTIISAAGVLLAAMGTFVAIA